MDIGMVLPLLLLALVPSRALETGESTSPEYRLPNYFQPSHYEVHFTFDESAFTASGDKFSGVAVIYFTTTQAVDAVKLHASSTDLDIESVELNNNVVPSSDISINSTTDIMTINYSAGLTVGTQYALKFTYTGVINTVLDSGIYKVSFTDAYGFTKYVVTSQFQPNDAKRAFPSFDEPSLKATFQLLITHPSSLLAETNTPGTVVQIPNPGKLTTQFDKTPVMSSYLVALVVSEYTCSVGAPVDTAVYRVCSKDVAEAEREFALDVGPKILAGLNEWTAYNYSNAMAKVDQIAVPNKGGAMENWGMVTYGESYILWNPETSTNAYKEAIATIISHEFSHFWFGDLVTCAWWSETFLNEGFATYFEFFGVHQVLPEWNMDKFFVVTIHQYVFANDALLTAVPLQSQASTTSEINVKFGTITYYKGGSILRMAEHIVGLDNFKAGVRQYLQTHKFNNTKPEDLWSAINDFNDPTITKLGNVKINEVMENWVTKSGYPLLYVRELKDSIEISQKRFLTSGEDLTSKWHVPVSYTASSDTEKFTSTNPRAWLTPTSNLTIDWDTSNDWIILNNHASAFYRVNYEDSLWTKIEWALTNTNFSGIPELNRAQIVDDSFQLAKLDQLTFSKVFSIVEFLKQDESLFAWYPARTEFNLLFTRFGKVSKLGQALSKRFGELSSAIYDSVPLSIINVDDQFYTTKQTPMATFACLHGNEKCANEARAHFLNYKNSNVALPKNLRGMVLCNGLRYSQDSNDWYWVFNKYLQSTSSSDRSLFISGMGCSRNETLLNYYLSQAISSTSGVIQTDIPSIYTSMLTNPIGISILIDNLITNYQALINRLDSLTSFMRIITNIAAYTSTQDHLDKLETLFDSEGLPMTISILRDTILSVVENRLNWISKYEDDLKDYLGVIDDPTISTTSTTSSTTSTTTTTTTARSTTTRTTTAATTTTATESPDGAGQISASILLTIAFMLVAKFVM